VPFFEQYSKSTAPSRSWLCTGRGACPAYSGTFSGEITQFAVARVSIVTEIMCVFAVGRF